MWQVNNPYFIYPDLPRRSEHHHSGTQNYNTQPHMYNGSTGSMSPNSSYHDNNSDPTDYSSLLENFENLVSFLRFFSNPPINGVNHIA